MLNANLDRNDQNPAQVITEQDFSFRIWQNDPSLWIYFTQDSVESDFWKWVKPAMKGTISICGDQI
jgi:hypothetical protein